MTLQGPNQMPWRPGVLATMVGLVVPLGLAGGVRAEPAAPMRLAQANIEALKQRDQELEAVRKQQQEAGEVEARLRGEIQAISSDRRKLNEQLIATATRVRTIEARIVVTEDRLKPLDANESAIRKSLEARRAVIAEILAALQRMGHRPPPALLVRPQDALAAVRSAMMLGAVLPDMRHEAATLAGDLADLVRLRKEIAEQRDRLAKDLAAQMHEQQRLALLTQERAKQQAATEGELAAARQRAVALARDAENLKDLIAKLERGLDSATRAARAGTEVDSGRPPPGALDAGRMTPAVAFASAKHTLPLPVNGVKIREYGAADGIGGVEKGLSFATRNGAQVTGPCDGWVVYAGPFRSYGQLLILDAGGGYHVLLAGMERISVEIGQFVLTGEPVAVMGSGSRIATILDAGSSQPVLYVEFRKDGTPIDPGPWWAASEGEKARG
jgi:septal ring factor EnvC (AmiA/AmiB activator)